MYDMGLWFTCIERKYSICAGVCLIVFHATAFNLPLFQDGITTPTTLQNVSSSEPSLNDLLKSSIYAPREVPLLNLTTPDLKSGANSFNVRCSPGRELIYNDCLDALNTFLYPLDRNLTIGRRVGIHSRWDLELPVRWISGDLCSTLVENASC